jgi:hypothetical protein
MARIRSQESKTSILKCQPMRNYCSGDGNDGMILFYSVVYWSEFLATDPEDPGSIPCPTTFSEW